MSGEPRSKKLKTQIALSALCQELQGNVSSLSSTDQQANTGAISSRSGLLFQRLLELNRTATAGTRNTKKTLSESKGALDAASLRLQNLQYERLHLEREIAATETFATIYQQIPLISETEFEAEAPESLRMAIPSKDPHQFMLNRLTYELEERKRLAETVKTLQDRKAAMEKGNKALIQDFTKLDSEIETLLTSTIPFQTTLGLRITKRKREDALAELLPEPLQTLYQSIQAYNEPLLSDSPETALSWEILGDREAAKTWKEGLVESQPTEVPTSSESKEIIGEEDDESSMNAHRRATKALPKTNLYTKHPLEFLIRLPQKSSVMLKLTFAYFDKLGVIGVVLGGEKNASLVDLTPSFVLSHLIFDEDDGMLCPETALSTYGDLAAIFEPKSMGNSRPYKWAQSLCSLDSSRSVTLSDLVSSVSDRWTNMKGLEGTLELLKLYKLHPNFKIPLETGRIKSYKMSTEPPKSVGMRTYYLTVEINSVSYDFTIDVSAAYPKKAPVFTYIPDKPPAATDSGEEEETVIPPTPLLLFFNGLLAECHDPISLSDPCHILFWQISHLIKGISEKKEETVVAVEESKIPVEEPAVER